MSLNEQLEHAELQYQVRKQRTQPSGKRSVKRYPVQHSYCSYSLCILLVAPSPHKRFLVGCSSLVLRLAGAPQDASRPLQSLCAWSVKVRFAPAAIIVCLVGESPMCSVPAM